MYRDERIREEVEGMVRTHEEAVGSLDDLERRVEGVRVRLRTMAMGQR